MNRSKTTGNGKGSEMEYTAKQIAKMIDANCRAATAGVITWEQFGRVNGATWDAASMNKPLIIGSPASRFVTRVNRELRKLSDN